MPFDYVGDIGGYPVCPRQQVVNVSVDDGGYLPHFVFRRWVKFITLALGQVCRADPNHLCHLPQSKVFRLPFPADKRPEFLLDGHFLPLSSSTGQV